MTILVKARRAPKTLHAWYGYYRFDSREPFRRVESRHGPIRFTTKKYALDSAAHTVRNAQG